MSLFWLNAENIQGLTANVIAKFESPTGGTTATAVLSEISKATEKKSNQKVMPRSIPHPFAKSIMMQKYLFMETKGQNEFYELLVKRKIGEWRGFIAMLALQKVYDLDLSIRMIQHNELDDTGLGKCLRISREGQPAADAKLVPLTDKAKDYFYILYIQSGDEKRAVGMSDDITLFLPGYTKDIFMSLEYPWSGGTIFKNPLEKGEDENSRELTRGEKIILYAWIEKAMSMLEGDEISKNASIIQKLREYRNDIEISAKDKEIAREIDANALPLSNDRAFVFDALNIDIDITSIQKHSEVKEDESSKVIWVNIESERITNMQFKIPRLVVGAMDSEMYMRNLDKMGFDKKFHDDTITVYPINYSSEHDLNMLLEDTCYYIEYSTDRLKQNNIDLKISSNNICVSDGGTTKRMYVWPIKQDVKESTRNILMDILRVEELSAGSIEISCRFGNKANDISKKTIHNTVKINDDFSAPNTFIWPNIGGMSEYYFNTVITNRDKGFAFLPYNKDIDSKKYKYQTFSISEYPNILKCVHFNGASINTVGYIKLLPPENSSKNGAIENNTAVYSLDFGTSSSVIAKKTSKGCNILEFENQTAIISCTPDIAKDYIHEIFFAHDELKTPVPTMYRENGDSEYHPPGIFEKGHAYFIDSKRLVSSLDENILSDIKFGTHNNLAIDYIKSAIEMILVDAKRSGYKQIELFFSYPISIVGAKEYREHIKEAVSKINSEIRFGIRINGSELMTESEAALRYTYHNSKENLRQNMIIIDIGGGSVDMAVHVTSYGSPLCSIASIEQGSRKFLLDTFKGNSKFFVNLVNRVLEKNRLKIPIDKYTKIDEFEKYVKEDPINFYSLIEMLLGYKFTTFGETKVFGEEMALEFKTYNDPMYRNIEVALLIQISAFVFYTGLMMDKICDGKGMDTVNTLTMSFTGKGSSITSWFSNKILSNLFSKMLHEVSNMGLASENISVDLLPQMAKGEAALGMHAEPVVRGKKIYDENNFSFDFVVGEKLLNIKNEKSYMSLLPHQLKGEYSDVDYEAAQMLKDKSTEVKIDKNMPILRSFIDIFNKNSGTVNKIKIREGKSRIEGNEIIINENELLNAIDTYTNDYMSSGYAVEPVFFTLVRKIREEIIKIKQ
ncbi:MAG: hypothetical protein AB1Z23_09655 [Eubacteriales bacterium]